MSQRQRPRFRTAVPLAIAGCALGCAAPVRPTVAAAWCAGEDDKVCGERYAALFAATDLLGPDDGNREGMSSWFRYRCAFEPGSKGSLEGESEPGLDCWRAAQLALVARNAELASELAERGCVEFELPQSCLMTGSFAREKFDLRLAHEFECRAKRAAEQRGEQLAALEGLECDPGSDSRARLRAAELARLSRPAAPFNLVSCAIHGCTLGNGRRVERWIEDWSP